MMKKIIKDLMYDEHGIPLSDGTLKFILEKIPNSKEMNFYELSEEVYKQYQEYLKCLFDSFVDEFKISDIDWTNKLENLSESDEISEEEYNFLRRYFGEYEYKIFEYIKENIRDYEEEIIDNLIQINRDIATFKDLYDTALDAGLYNCDSLYLEAIKNLLPQLENNIECQQKKVYIVTDKGAYGLCIMKCFANKKDAQQYLNEIWQTRKDTGVIEEWELF